MYQLSPSHYFVEHVQNKMIYFNFCSLPIGVSETIELLLILDKDLRMWPFRANSAQDVGRYFCSGETRCVELNLDSEKSITLPLAKLSTHLTSEYFTLVFPIRTF